MDKRGKDAKSRGAIRYKHSKPKLSSGVLSRSEAKREKKVRKLSSVGRSSLSNEDCEMESLGAIKDENELPSFAGKNTNISKRKFFDDCNDVGGHASVPRRLRSAMTKRYRDSTSPPLPDPKKVKPHVRDGKNSTMKKPKSNMVKRQGKSEKRSKGVLSGPITKDEEEVAETLFALAGLFANKPNKGKSESLDPNPSQVPVSNDDNPPEIQAVVALPTVERSSENLKAESWNQPNSGYSEKLLLPPNDTSSAKFKEQCDEKALPGSSAEFCDPSDQLSDIRSRHALQNKSSFLERKPEMLSGMATSVGCQVEPRQKPESKKSGMALWPGSPSTSFPKAPRADDQSLPSSSSKLPAWLDAACSESRRTSAQNDSVAKVCKVRADRRLSKRCATHVYICNLIQDSRTSGSEERSSPHLQSQTRARDGLNRVVSSTTSCFNGYGIGVNPVVSATNVHPSSNLSEIGTLNQTNNLDRPRSSAAISEVSSWQKQSFDMFMSLARDSSGRSRHGGSESNPYLASLGQHQFGASFSLPHPCYNSSSDHFPTLQQVQMQLQSHITPLYSAQGGPQGMTKHHHRHQQEFGEYYNREEKPMLQFLSLQSGVSTSPMPRQQFPMTVASLPFSAGKVDRGGGFRTNAPLALQLLCTDRR